MKASPQKTALTLYENSASSPASSIDATLSQKIALKTKYLYKQKGRKSSRITPYATSKSQ
jgi:hypothetical protein